MSNKRAGTPNTQAPPKKRKLAIRDDVLNLTEPHPNYNTDITKILLQLGEIEKNTGFPHKAKAYSTAAASLASYPARITSGAAAKKLDGVGVKIAKKIQEILDTGKLNKLDKMLAKPEIQAINLYCRISGVGQAAAKKWVTAGKRTLDDLKDEKLTHHQQVGLKYFNEFEKRIPRAEMRIHDMLIKKYIKKVDPAIKAKLCGSYRRGLENSGDIDILCTHPKYTNAKKDSGETYDIIKKIVQKLESKGYIIDELTNGPHMFMGVCRLPEDEMEKATARRLDIKLFPIETFYPALLHFTGSGEHNRQLSCIAINKGFKLSEYCLCPVGVTGVVGSPLPVESEKDIFDMLGVPYREPEQRSI